MNKNVISITRFAAVAAGLAAAMACEATKSRTPTSPNVAGPIAGVSITTPAPVSPANGQEVLNTEPLRLVFGNASTNGERPFWYVVELAADAGFNTKLYTNPKVTPASGGQTTIVVDAVLGTDATYYWRVKADDGANASQFSSAAYFDLVVPVVIEAPAAVSPNNGERTENNTPALVVNNGREQGRVGSVEYRFEVARDAAFNDMVSVAHVARNGGSQTVHPSAPLPQGATLYWRARGTNGEIGSGWSNVASFRTPAPPAPPPPPGGGGGGGPTNPGGPCNFSAPDAIVSCERAKYGYMDGGQMLEFLRNVARSLNRNGIGGGPFGILRKGGGHNCGGYSCDVICAGQGTSQRQYDVLGDIDGSQYPAWSGPMTWPNIRVDTCEIQ